MRLLLRASLEGGVFAILLPDTRGAASLAFRVMKVKDSQEDAEQLISGFPRARAGRAA